MRRLRASGIRVNTVTARRLEQSVSELRRPSLAPSFSRHLRTLVVPGFDCSARLRQRLGLLLPGRLGAFARFPVLGVLCRPSDKWWRADNPNAIEKAREAILTYGLVWLESNTPSQSMEPTR